MVDGRSAELDGLRAAVRAPLALAVTGRRGAGRRTVAEAMRAAGALIVAADQSPEVWLYVLVDTVTDEDRDALSALAGSGTPCVAVLNKADLSGFRGAGPMAAAAKRCRILAREVGVPAAPLAALCARAAYGGIDDVVLVGLRTLALDPSRLTAAMRGLLRAELDLYGLAHAVVAVRAGAGAVGVAAALRRASGVDGVMVAVDRAGAGVRYRRLTSESTLLMSRIGSSPAVEDARAEAAADVVRSAGMPAATPETATPETATPETAAWGAEDSLRTAVTWQRYASGPVAELHRECALDLSRAWLRQWAEL